MRDNHYHCEYKHDLQKLQSFPKNLQSVNYYNS